MMQNRLIASLIFLIALTVPAWAELKHETIWEKKGEGGFSAANALIDQKTGAVTGIIVSEGDVGVVRLDQKGERVWEYKMTPPVSAAPAVGDLDGDGLDDIVAADGVGNIVALDADGKPLWTATVTSGVLADSCPAIADLDGDDEPEILVGDTNGVMSCFNAEGELQWQFGGDGTQMGPVLVADLYDRPGQEIITASHDRHIYALGADGSWLWDIECPTDLFPNSTPILADTDGDNTPEIFLGGGLHHLYRIDPQSHRIVLEDNVHLHVNSAITGTDLNGDGKDEIIFGNKGGEVKCYSDNGYLWQKEYHHSFIYSSPIVVNLDADPDMEILLYSIQQDLHVLDADGTELQEFRLAARAHATPLAGDLDGDGMLEVLVTSPGGMHGGGAMVWTELNVPFKEDPRNHLIFSGNRANCGTIVKGKTFAPAPLPKQQKVTTSLKVSPVDPLQLLSGTNTWRFNIQNPESKRLVFMVELIQPRGVVVRTLKHVRNTQERAVFAFTTDKKGTYKVNQKVIDADSLEILFENEETLKYKGFRSDEDYLDDVLFDETEEALKQWADSNELAAANFNKRLLAMRGTLQQLKKSKDANRLDVLCSLREDASRLRALALAGSALAPEGSFIAWDFCPWAYFDRVQTLPSPQDCTEKLALSLCQGEYGSIALNLTNLSAKTLEVRVIDGNLDDKKEAWALDHLQFRHAVTVPTIRRKQIADALPELDSAGLLAISPLQTEQLWITVNTNGLEAGDYVCNLRLRSLEPDPTERQIPIELKVYDLEMPRPRPLRFCQWSYSGGRLGTDNDAALQDLVEHGVTILFNRPPKALTDADGKYTGELDFTEHDQQLKRLAPHAMLLYLGPQGQIKDFPSETWRAEFIDFLHKWVAHMKELGLDYDDWALYPYDEPSTPYASSTINLVKVAKVVREADPNILIYTDPTSGTTQETIDMFAGLIDIWCPSDELLERLPEIVPAAHKYGKELWYYDAAGRAKTLSCFGMYRWRFWNAWNLGMTGVGWWCYNFDHPDNWDGPNDVGDFFRTVYRGPGDVPVSSKRWETAREGIQDYERLWLLREMIQDAKKRGGNNTTVQKAEQLLAELPLEITDVLLNTGRRTPLTPDGVPVYEEAERRLEEAREKIAEMCLELGKHKQ